MEDPAEETVTITKTEYRQLASIRIAASTWAHSMRVHWRSQHAYNEAASSVAEVTTWLPIAMTFHHERAVLADAEQRLLKLFPEETGE